MAITVTDLGTSAQTNTASPSLASITAALNDIIVLSICTAFAEPAPQVVTCTHSGNNFTPGPVAGPVGTSGNASWGMAALLYLVVTDPDTADILVGLEYGPTNTSSWITAWRVEGGDTASPMGDTDVFESSGSSSALSLTAPVGSAVFSTAIAPDGWTDLTLSPQAGLTADYQNDPAGTAAIVEVGAGHRISAADPTSVGWNLTYSKPLMHAGMVINAAGGGGGRMKLAGPGGLAGGAGLAGIGGGLVGAPVAKRLWVPVSRRLWTPERRRAA